MKPNIDLHLSQFPHSAIHVVEGRLYAHFMIGNHYKRKLGYYGEYPPGYLERIYSLFPTNPKLILHAFSGTLIDTWSIDLRPEMNPSVVCPVEHVHEVFEPNSFDLILADPPYSHDDAKKYGVPYPNKPKCLSALYSVASPQAILTWLDTAVPRWTNKEWKLYGLIGVFCGSNRKFRVAAIFQRN